MLLESYEDEIKATTILRLRSAMPNSVGDVRWREIPKKADYISDGWYRYKNTRRNKVGFLDKDKNLIIDFIYDDACAFSEGMAGVKLNGKWGFIDESKNIVIDFQYDNAYKFEHGLCMVFQNGKGYFIDKTGKKLPNISFDNASSFVDGYSIIGTGDKKGIIDQTGNYILPVAYDNVYHFFNDRACVVKDGKYGFIDRQGNWILEPQFDYLYDFEFGFTKAIIKTVNDEKEEIFVHKDGRIVDWVSLSYFKWEDVKLTLVEDKEKFGFTDREGNIVIKTIYDDAELFQEGFASIEVNGKYGFINEQGVEVIKPIYDYYDECDYMRQGHVIMRLGNKKGILNSKGEVVVDFIYDSMDSFSAFLKEDDISSSWIDRQKDVKNTFIVVEKDNKFGVMSMTGKIMLPIKFNVIQTLVSGLVLAVESEDSACYFYYADGTLANPQGFNYITPVEHCSIAIYWQNQNEEGQGPFGYVDVWGNILTPPQYKDAREFGQAYRPNTKDLILAPIMNYQNKWGYIDITGKRVITCEFDDAMPFAKAYVPSKRKSIRTRTFFAMIEKQGKWGYIELIDDELRMPTSYHYSDEDVEKLYANIDKKGAYWQFADEFNSFFQ